MIKKKQGLVPELVLYTEVHRSSHLLQMQIQSDWKNKLISVYHQHIIKFVIIHALNIWNTEQTSLNRVKKRCWKQV
jgi:hypothetical protein